MSAAAPGERADYVALDALRGAAALSVLFFHLGHWLAEPWFAANARLAVDFFFCLSGYVLAMAYGRRLDAGMGTAGFMRVRLIRLMPVIAIGTLISTAYLAFRIALLHYSASPTELAGAALLGLFCLPYFNASAEIGGPEVFPLNGPQYTLFLELAVNWLWAATRRWEGLGLAVTLTCAGYAVMIALGTDIGGDTSQNFWLGLPRVLGAYYSGVAICRMQRRYPALQRSGLGLLFAPLAIISALLFYWPQPLPKMIGIGWRFLIAPLRVLSGSSVRLARIYALHYPIFVWVNGGYQLLLRRRDFSVLCCLATAAVVIGSWLALRLLDTPIRSWLMQKVRSSPLATGTA